MGELLQIALRTVSGTRAAVGEASTVTPFASFMESDLIQDIVT